MKWRLKTFSLLELLIVIVLIGILSSMFYFIKVNKPIDYYNNHFIVEFTDKILSTKVKNSYDIPIFCKPSWCVWKNNCIVDWYDFNKIANDADFKYVVNHIIEYKICPLYLPDGSINYNTAINSIPNNPSFYIKRQDKTTNFIIFPIK